MPNEIRDLKEKLRFLKENKQAQRVGCHNGGGQNFADAIGKPRTTVNSWLDDNGNKNSRLSESTWETIADRFKFPSMEPNPWLNGSGRDFEAGYLKLHPDDAKATSRQTTAPLMPGEDRAPERCSITGLASIELSCGQTAPGQTDIGVTISCGISHIPGSPYSITVRAALLLIKCGKARANDTTIRGFGQAMFTLQGSTGDVCVRWNGGDTQNMMWMLGANSASLGVVKLEPGGLARIERMAPGDVISGSLSAWLKNIDGEDIQTRTTDAIAIVDNRGDPAEILEDNLSIVQRRIIEHFRKRVLELDEDGLAVLARHELQFIRIP